MSILSALRGAISSTVRLAVGGVGSIIESGFLLVTQRRTTNLDVATISLVAADFEQNTQVRVTGSTPKTINLPLTVGVAAVGDIVEVVNHDNALITINGTRFSSVNNVGTFDSNAVRLLIVLTDVGSNYMQFVVIEKR